MLLRSAYKVAVRTVLNAPIPEAGIVEEGNLAALPEVVQTYLRNCGVVGKPNPFNMRLRFRGRMRNRQSDWFPFTSEQYSFFRHPTRLFLMRARVRGMMVSGYHCYRKEGAFMKIRLWGIWPVATYSGPEIFRADSVTFLNDLCLFNPAGLTDPRFQWEDVESDTPKVIFINGPVRVSARLHFDSSGNLMDFLSPDRYDVNARGCFPFSTPVDEYTEFSGIRMPAGGRAIWHYLDGPFTYGEFHLEDLAYNLPLEDIES